MEKYVKMLKGLALTVKEHVSKAIDPIKDRLDEVEEKLSSIEDKEIPIDDIAIQAAMLIEKPKDGINGADGKSVTVDDVKPLINEAVNEAVKQIPIPDNGKDGINGKDADPEFIKQAVKEEVFTIFDKIELPKDGKSIEPEEVRLLILDELSKLELPKGEQGIKGDIGEKGDKGEKGEIGLTGANGLSAYEIAQAKGFIGAELDWLSSLKGEKGIDGKDGRDGRDGKDGLAGRDGENGKDALQIEVLPLIDESKTYSRGIYSSHDGGLWQAIKNTQGMDGWSCLVDGIKDINIKFDGEREITIEVIKSSNQIITKSFAMPVMIYKGIYNSYDEYKQGDTVTWGGSLWHCQELTTDKPGESKAWVLCAKKGRDGKDGEKGDKGERGSNGKDLTKPTINNGSW